MVVIHRILTSDFFALHIIAHVTQAAKWATD